MQVSHGKEKAGEESMASRNSTFLLGQHDEKEVREEVNGDWLGLLVFFATSLRQGIPLDDTAANDRQFDLLKRDKVLRTTVTK